MTQKTTLFFTKKEPINTWITGSPLSNYMPLSNYLLLFCFVLFFLNTVVATDFDFNCKDHRKGLNEKVKSKVFL